MGRREGESGNLTWIVEFQLKHLAFMTKLQEGKYVEAVHFARVRVLFFCG